MVEEDENMVTMQSIDRHMLTVAQLHGLVGGYSQWWLGLGCFEVCWRV